MGKACRIVLHIIGSLMLTGIIYRIEECFSDMEGYPWGKWEFDFFKKVCNVCSFSAQVQYS